MFEDDKKLIQVGVLHNFLDVYMTKVRSLDPRVCQCLLSSYSQDSPLQFVGKHHLHCKNEDYNDLPCANLNHNDLLDDPKFNNNY